MPKKRIHVQLTTLLVVGEGLAEKAFLNHMKSLYDHRNSGQTITIHAADGGSPGSIIKDTQRKYKHSHYDRSYILLDEDIEITNQDRKTAKRLKIELIISSPLCLEGMLLDVLNQPIPGNANATTCKNLLHPQLSGKYTDRHSYAELLPREILDETTKEQIVKLRQALSNTSE